MLQLSISVGSKKNEFINTVKYSSKQTNLQSDNFGCTVVLYWQLALQLLMVKFFIVTTIIIIIGR